MTHLEIEEVVNLWQERLGLGYWNIKVLWGDDAIKEFAGKNAHAVIYRSKSYDEARLAVNQEEYQSWSKKEAEKHIVHELLHLIFRDTEFVIDQLDGLLHRDVDNLITETFSHHLEGAIDRVANRLVDLVQP